MAEDAEYGQRACTACGFVAGAGPPGGTVLRMAAWVVQHSVGPLGLGTLAVMPIRHVVHVADLTESESLELGPLLQRVSAAVTAIMNPEQVYVCLWSHMNAVPGHIHFVVQPVLGEDLARYGAYGPVLQIALSDAGNVPDRAAVETVCDHLRAVLGAREQTGRPRGEATP